MSVVTSNGFSRSHVYGYTWEQAGLITVFRCTQMQSNMHSSFKNSVDLN